MAIDEKDRFGDKLRDKQRADEDRFFADRDRQLMEKLRKQSTEQGEATLRELAKGRCPKCGERLEQRSFEGVDIDDCPSCRGIWLDQGELEALSRHEAGAGNWLARVLGVTRRER
jgi:hypothetical protein